MTLDDAVARIQLGLGFRTTQAENIKTLIREAQRELEMSPILPWFLIEEDVTLSGSADDPDVALPDGFLMECEDEPPRFVESSGKVSFLKKGSFDNLTTGFQDLVGDTQVTSRATRARWYSLRKSSIRIFPTPTAAWSLLWTYYAKEDTLDVGSATNDWLSDDYFPDLIIGIAGKKMAKILRDTDAYAEFDRMYTMAGAAIQAHTINREVAGAEIIMGSES